MKQISLTISDEIYAWKQTLPRAYNLTQRIRDFIKHDLMKGFETDEKFLSVYNAIKTNELTMELLTKEDDVKETEEDVQ